MSDIINNLLAVRQRLAAAARAANRDAGTIQLIAVSKGKSAENVRAAIAAGQRIFGENRVQETEAKFTGLRLAYPDIELHLIGPLQTNKAEDAVKLFDVIETLDRPRLAQALAAAIKKTGRKPRFYIEVNIGAESQKAGVAPMDLGDFLKFCRDECALAVEGLMCIPPHGRDPASFFACMRELATQYNLPCLSMGMSADFETAIHHGATQIRIGTAIFGARHS
jgi:pyridoxal phosphate enzyme (YggS family)